MNSIKDFAKEVTNKYYLFDKAIMRDDYIATTINSLRRFS